MKPEGAIRLLLSNCEFKEACEYVELWHRHARPPAGHRFSLKATGEDGKCHGVAIVGRPVARMAQDGHTVELLRMPTDGTPNACSFLLGAVKRAARALGYKRLLTYTLATESGSSPRAAGFTDGGCVPAASWKRSKSYGGYESAPLFGETRRNLHSIEKRKRWVVDL